MRPTTTPEFPSAAETSKDVHNAYSRTTYSPGRRAIRTVESPNELFGPPSVPPSPNDSEAFFAQSPPSSSSSSSPSSSSRSKRSWSPINGHDDDSDDDSSSKRLKSASPPPQGPRTRLPDERDTFDDFRRNKEIAFVDKMQHALRLPEEFKYILVRPPRFGKTAFISLLRQCYDVRAETASSRNRHLCLRFAFRPLVDSRRDLSVQICDVIFFALDSFLYDYSKELDPPSELNPPSLGSVPVGELLAQVIALVRDRGLTLFVSVDSLDAPFRPPPPGRYGRYLDTPVLSGREIAEILEENLWGPLVGGYDVIPKLIVSASLLPHSSLLQRLKLNAPAELNAACGFTAEEAAGFCRSILGEEVSMDGLESLSGDYSFSDPHSPSDPLLHPQKAISWIEQHAGPSDEDGSFQLLSYLLNLLPQYSDVSGVPSVDDLIDVVATGAVDVDITADSFVDDDLSLPTWNALYYAGALTRDPRRPETLRLCNGAAALAIIHDTLDKFMPDRYDRRTVFLTAWSRFCDHRPNSLLKILEGIFHDQTARAFGKSHEPNLHGIFELLLRSKETVPNRSLRARPFIVSPSQIATHPVICEIPSRGPTDTISVELLTITLVGLWRGENPNEDGRRPTKDELETLFNAVSGEEEAVLLARQYRVWSETLNAMETVVVGSLMRSGSELIQLVAIGGARVLYRGPPPPTPEPTHGCQSCGCTCGNSKSDPEDDCYNYKSY